MTEQSDIIDLGFGGSHARLSPSAAERWMTCPGSVLLSEKFDDESSIYAAEGTAAHWVREQCLRNGQNVEDFVGRIIHTEGYYFEVLESWIGFLQPTIDWAREQKGEMFVEYRVDLGAWLPGQFGTLDLGFVLPDLIIVNDLKFGQGVLVDAERNKQQMLYAVGFWENYARHHTDAKEFLLMIDQPRGQGGKGSEWRIHLDDLLKFAEEAAAAAKLVDDPDAPLKVSLKGCQFCAVAANFGCPALHDFCQELVGINPDVPELKGKPQVAEIDQLTPERRSYIIQHWPLIAKWGQQVKGFQLDQAIAGNPTPGFKAVATQGNREWTDKDQVEEVLVAKKIPAKDIFNKSLKSPTQMESILGTRNWQQMQEYITRPEGPPALVPESDARPALMAYTDMLDDLPDDEDAPEVTDDLDDLI